MNIKLNPILIHKDPKIIIYDNFLDKLTCENLIKKYEKKLSKSKTTSGKVSNYSLARLSKSYFIKQNNETLLNISKRIKNLNDWQHKGCENFQITNYGINEFYKPHYDAFDILDDENNQNIKDKGQRMITNILYLNDVIEGGATFFTKLNITIKPKAGRLLTFTNCIENTNYLNPFSLHESSEVIRGEKWILTLWLREQ